MNSMLFLINNYFLNNMLSLNNISYSSDNMVSINNNYSLCDMLFVSDNCFSNGEHV